MLPKYTFALGGTDAIKKFIEYVESQKTVLETIKKKYENKEAFAI